MTHKLTHTTGQNTAAQDVEVQAAFCIDVRSEPVRRALEAVRPAIQTIGFAGFFGLPAADTPMATQARRPQLPGLLAPSIEVTDRVVSSGNVAKGADAALQRNSHRVRLDCFDFTNQWQGLQSQGISMPEEAAFVEARHNTTTNEIKGFDLDLLSPATRARWDRLQGVFTHACDQVRRERAPKLGVDPRAAHGDLLDQLRRRANDGAQTRPEWGLAGNAAFLIAPRERSRGLALDGRSFLLELLMTAPMLVTHWSNWQYHASTYNPLHLGSGSKILPGVVGGHIGVIEGNGGDLSIGLSRQSRHDGERWVHEPLRLTVVIDAPQQSIEAVIHKHTAVQQLLNHGWLYLWRFDQAGLLQYEMGAWRTVVLEPI
jgi:uncharacterized protein YbcC (UPF0753/DUF2309 family)